MSCVFPCHLWAFCSRKEREFHSMSQGCRESLEENRGCGLRGAKNVDSPGRSGGPLNGKRREGCKFQQAAEAQDLAVMRFPGEARRQR